MTNSNEKFVVDELLDYEERVIDRIPVLAVRHPNATRVKPVRSGIAYGTQYSHFGRASAIGLATPAS